VDFNFPGATGEMQESELGLIPKGWEVATLGDIIRIKHGFAFKGDYFSEEETDDILVTPGNFRIGGGFNYSKLKYYDGEYSSEYILNSGDLIVTMTDLSKEGDTLGYPALVPHITGKKLLHNQRIGKVELNKNSMLKTYIYFAMCQNSYRNYVLSGATGTTVKHTSPGRISDYMLVIPTAEILLQFEKISQSLIDNIGFNYLQNQMLAQTRDTFVPKLMNGEIVV
jgi:type I restriction enzyme S subunit